MSPEGEEGFYKLPNEILLKIFQYLTEQHLCCVSKVCTFFWRIANEKLLWKSLYHQVYEYDQPLFISKLGKFEFISESEYENLWKKSFMQLYRGVHVRPGFKNVTFERDKDRNLQYFNTIFDALGYVEGNRKNLSSLNLVFLHASTYNLDYLGNDDDFVIDIESNVMLIGAASGKNIAKSVIIKSNANIIRVKENLRCVYVGYLTLEVTSSNSRKTCCLKIHGSPIIDHCIIRSFNCNSPAIYVSGSKANPLVKNCDISNCESVGLYVGYLAMGTYEDNIISYNTNAGIFIIDSARFTIRRNNIYENNHSNHTAGIFICCGRGCFEDNEIYDNGIGFIIISCLTNLIIRKNKIFNKGILGYTQSIGVSFRDYSRGKLEDNKIYNHSNCGVEISKGSKAVMHSNTMKDNAINVFEHTT